MVVVPRKGVPMGTVYSQEFKDQIVELHRRGRSFMDPSREFNLSATSIANWSRAAEKRAVTAAEHPAGSESDQQKITRLERDLARKEEEVEILGKALTFFARRADQ